MILGWKDDVLVAEDSDRETVLFSVLPNGNLEIRGGGFDKKYTKSMERLGLPRNGDRPRVCKLGSVETAREIAEMVANLI